MKFYRIEHKETRFGVYKTIHLLDIITRSGFSDFSTERHPIPHNDSLMASNCELKGVDKHAFRCDGNWRFGFSSKKQMRAWFYKDSLLRELLANDAVISVYNAPARHVIKGHTQAAMHSAYHTLKHRIQEISLDRLTQPIEDQNLWTTNVTKAAS